uniref:OJ1485_B09.9 protein n=1 Tax=Oryza sativa subsp. japonica TaxID=39947 RepID=Q8RZI7_ORYSJ|nr:OJ1485_B09.9 [Oryza sativa Japonica Group]
MAGFVRSNPTLALEFFMRRIHCSGPNLMCAYYADAAEAVLTQQQIKQAAVRTIFPQSLAILFSNRLSNLPGPFHTSSSFFGGNKWSSRSVVSGPTNQLALHCCCAASPSSKPE